jgi:uncharacterized protein YodC (DUF2158 family)
MDITKLYRLKSGGPAMTIQSKKDDEYLCFWFDGTKLKKALLPCACLELVGEDIYG